MKRRLLEGSLILVILICGCSVQDPRRMAQTNITLAIENSRFHPQRWIVPSGKEIHLHIENPAGDQHDIVILKGQALGETDPAIFENQFWSVAINQTMLEVTFLSPAMPGEYRIVCSVGDHQEKGEQGILVVVIP